MENIGTIIKSERIKRHITQKALAENICSTSYLSKIESGKQIPQDEVINALINRLQINLEQYIHVDEEQFMRESYNEIHCVILKNDSCEMKKTIDHYLSMNLEFKKIENFYSFNLRLFHLYLLADVPLSEIDTFRDAFSTVEEKLNDSQKFVYYINCYLYCKRQKKYQDGLSYLDKAGLLLPKVQLKKDEKARYYSMLSTVYYKLHRTLNSIKYALLALKLFTELEQPQQMVNCTIQLSLSYIQNGHYSSALEILDECYDVCSKYNLAENYGSIYQYIGYIYSCEGDSRGAISYFRKSLAVETEPLRILITIHSLVKEYSKLKRTTCVETWCEKGLQLIEDSHLQQEAIEFFYHFSIYKIIHHIIDFDWDLIASGIDYFQQIKDYKNVYKYATLFGNLLCKQEEYQKATYYYQIANDVVYAIENIQEWEDLS